MENQEYFERKVKELLNLNHINALLSQKEAPTPISDYLNGEKPVRKGSNPQFKKKG